MKRINSLLTISVIITAIGLFLSACTGPEGPSGKDGKDGKDGANGTAVCKTCHGTDDYNLKQNQFLVSKHGTGIIFEEENGRPGCAACHTGTGFQEAVALNQDDPNTASVGPIRCYTCHKLHTNFDNTDFDRRVTGAITLRQSGATVDFKEGNTCARCHQARKYTHTTATYDSVNASSTTTYSRFGPHYGVVANVFSNNGLEDIGQTTTNNPHANLPDGCVSCHMAVDSISTGFGGHTFSVPFAEMKNVNACANAACHGGASTVANYTKTKAIGTDIAKIRRKLIDLGYLDTTQALGTEGYNVLGEYFAAPKGGKKIGIRRDTSNVVLNYLFVAKDRR